MSATRDPSTTAFTHRLAGEADLPALRTLMAASIDQLQSAFLSPEQVAASRTLMGLDTQLVADRGYFVIEDGAVIVGSGGWSRRATLYGGDHSPGRDAAWLDPATDAARIRAMYTHPGYARRGIGRLILALCEAAAAEAGFKRVELVGTMAGEPLYTACGYSPIERFEDPRGGAPVPLVRMGKTF